MKSIVFSNKEINGLSILDIYKDNTINRFGIGGTLTELLLPFYQKLLKQVIGSKAAESFKDFALSKEQTEKIKTIFENEIDKNLPVYENYKGTKIPHKRLEWKGEIYELHLGLNSPNNRKIDDFYKIVEIAEECLKENKPMYLSIE